jgi:hypothetical protein
LVYLLEYIKMHGPGNIKQLNMFRAPSCPLSVVIAVLSPSSNGKPEAATAVVVAPDDEHKGARNMLSYI